MKEWIKDCFSDWIKSTEVYRQKEEEANDYNLECQRKEERMRKLRDDIKQCKAEKQECILSGQAVIEEKTNQIKGLKEQNKALEKQNATLEEKLQIKEQQRRKLAGSIGGYKSKINKQEKEINNLNERIEFLKSNRRAPNIEELKDYKYKRKKSVTK